MTQAKRLLWPQCLAGAALMAWIGVLSSATAQVPEYVGSDTCTDCHEEPAAAWATSHHAAAWTMADPSEVLGDFDGANFTLDGMVAEFRQDGDALTVAITEPGGPRVVRPVHSVVGIAPLQQYLLETEPGRLQSLDVVWDTEAERWYHLYPEQSLTPADALHWTGPYKNWNARCAECHATGYDKAYDPASRQYRSTQAEIGVGCEACHGPGAAHLAWAQEGTPPPASLTQTGLTVDLAQGGETLIQQCATCHARRGVLGDQSPVPGTPFYDTYRLSLLRPGLYHPDGQILDEVYVYGSFLQSRMYAQGVTCLDCHDAHSGARLVEDNGLCTQCHSPAGNPRFPSLRLADYDSPSHHHHADGTDGAQCKSCHMIERVYMGTDGRRDHSFRVPRPDLSVSLGTPNACSDCHDDQDASWAAAAVEGWYPDSPHRGPHPGQALARYDQAPQIGQGDLIAVALDSQQPAIFRASALERISAAPDARTADALAGLLADPNPAVRAQAVGVQRGAGVTLRMERLVPLLYDARRVVRIAVVQALLDAPADDLNAADRAALSIAGGEWQQALRSTADFPETQLVMGGIALTTRNFAAAARAFAEATQMDPQMVEAWIMQIRIAAATGNQAAVSPLVQEALRANPDDPRLQAIARQIGAQP